jgi:hypothetical protein
MFMKNFMEFHENFHGIQIPWKILPWKFPWKFHEKFHELTERFSPGSPWCSFTQNYNYMLVCWTGTIRIPWKIPWNSMEFRQLTEFDGIRF